MSRIIATNRYLQIIGKSEDNTCSFCSSYVETLNHLFWECRVVQLFISQISHLLNSQFGLMCNFRKRACFFPTLDECAKIKIIAFSIAKMVIYSARYNNHRPTIKHFLSSLQFEAFNEYHSARLSGDLDRYKNKWKELKLLPDVNIDLILHTNRHVPDIP